MRCLHCGKAIPLLKRLGGSSEFCSEAHRREYQHEFSQLALGRLMQSQPVELQAQAERSAIFAGAAARALDPPASAVNITSGVNGTPVLSGTSAAPKPSAEPHWSEIGRPANTLAAPAKSETPPMTPSKNGAAQPSDSQPAAAAAAPIQKPAPAVLQFALLAALEFEHAFASLAPKGPHHKPDVPPAELPQGHAVAGSSGIEIANSITRPMESKLDIREMSRTTPRIALDLRIVPPESLEMERCPLPIAVTVNEPEEASLWIGSHSDFTAELVTLSGFATAQFANSDFEAPALVSDSEEPVLAAIEPPVKETEATSAQSQTVAPSPAAQMPNPEFDPLPVNSAGIAPPRAKPIPVFGPVPINPGAVQIPRPDRMPLRPVMVLATATARATEVKHRAADMPSPRPALSIKPEAPASSTISSTTTAPSSELNLGLPELRMSTPGEQTLRMRKIIAAVIGVAVLGGGLFFFLGKRSDVGSKSPTAAVSAPAGQWIANFAPDSKRQRRVSLLRSSMNLSAYRLDFESSIQMKALGWVYRARDSKNFYVSKIEFQKPGVNPVYALVHYAVIDGVDQPRVETPLTVTVPMGGLYKIHFEAVGTRFTTWVQGTQVDQWTDPRLSSGGAGLYGEGSEQSVLHGDFVVTPILN